MKFTPFPYQEPMVDHLVDHDHAALFVFMGAGKTPCTLEALHRVGGKALIIAPLRVANMVWSDQVAQWGYPFKMANLRTKEGLQAWEDGTADIYTINFELVSGRGKKKGFLDEFVTSKKLPVDTLIIDELSLCKANSKRTKSIIKARKHFKRVWGLTGTPSPNGVLDLFYQLKVLDGGERLSSHITHFRNRWFTSDYMGYNWTPKQGAVEEIQERISDICLSVQSEEHLSIPGCDVVDIDVTLPAAVMRQYKALERNLVIQLGDNVVDAQSAATLVNKLQQFTAGTVYDEDGETVGLHTAKHKHLAKILGKHEPVLILTRYKSEMEALLEAFPQVEAFDEARMDDWVAGKIPAWVANPASLSHGIDRIQHSCSTIVWMSLTYSLEAYEQTNARILRTGQDNQAKIYRILSENTVDWVVASALENKAEGQSALMASIATLQRESCHADSKRDPQNRGLSSLF